MSSSIMLYANAEIQIRSWVSTLYEHRYRLYNRYIGCMVDESKQVKSSTSRRQGAQIQCIIIVTIIDCPGELTDDQAAFLLLPVRQSTIDIRPRCVGGRGWEWYL